MSKDLIARLMGANRHIILGETDDRLDSETWTPRLVTEARLVCRVLMNDPDSGNRSSAAELLGSVGNRTDLFTLKMACRDEDWVVRCSAYSSLAMVGGKGQFRFLRDLAEGEKHPVARRWGYVAAFDADRDRAVEWLRERWGLENDAAAEVGIVSCLFSAGVAGAEDRLREMASGGERGVADVARKSLAGGGE